MTRKRTVMEVEILRVAAEIFSEKGYRAATLDDLVNAAGISRATFYSYFPSKEELLCRLYRQHSSVTEAEIKRIVAQDLPVPEKLRRIIRFQVTYVASHKSLVQVFFSEVFNLPPQMNRTVQQANRAYNQIVEKVVAEGIQQGALSPIDPKLLTYGVMGMCTWLYRWYRPEGQQTPEAIADEFIRVLEGGYLRQDVRQNDQALMHEMQELRHAVEQVRATVLSPRTQTRRNAHSPANKKEKSQPRPPEDGAVSP
ncbi:MAG: TetR/AcrR family transcriptional regulator [Candidatus Binatia bacterium]